VSCKSFERYFIRRDNCERDKSRQNICCKLIRNVPQDIFVNASDKIDTSGGTFTSVFSSSLSFHAERQRINLRRDLRACVHAHACITHSPAMKPYHAHESLLCSTRMQLVWVITVSCMFLASPADTHIHIESFCGPTM